MCSASNDFVKPCTCGYTGSRRCFCDQPGLLNHWSFPPFADLPDENDLDHDYYGLDDSSGLYTPVRHWCLVGEIVDTSSVIRPRVLLETRFGEKVPVNFHLEDANVPKFFDWKDLRKGATMCILYPYRRTFADGKCGVRQESANTVMVFPASLESLTAELQAIGTSMGALKACMECGKVWIPKRTVETSMQGRGENANESDDSVKLSACARCKVTLYCSRECQRAHWACRHKQLCSCAPMLLKLAKLDFSKFGDHLDWSFDVKPAKSAAEKRSLADAAMQEYIGRMCPGQSLGLLRTLLERVGAKLLLSDNISQPIAKASGGRMIEMGDGFFEKPVAESFLCRSLMEFCTEQAKEARLRSHVVDLKGCPDSMKHLLEDLLLNILFLSIPKWQSEMGIRGICWAFEAHTVFGFDQAYGNDKEKAGWECKGKDGSYIETMTARHKTAGIACVWSDDMRVVAELANAMADARKDCLVLRVLRAVGNRKESVRTVVAQDTPNNVFTLWVREDAPMCGKFNPPRQGLSIAEQLCDCQEFDFMESLMDRHASNPSHSRIASSASPRVGRSNPREKPSKSSSSIAGERHLTCASCGQAKPREEFSRKQLSKKDQRRCAPCIQG